jgi:hypothetical protein
MIQTNITLELQPEVIVEAAVSSSLQETHINGCVI